MYTASLPGLPLSEKSSVLELLSHNVTVGIGIEEAWSARNTRFDAAWVRSFPCPSLTPLAQADNPVILDCYGRRRAIVQG